MSAQRRTEVQLHGSPRFLPPACVSLAERPDRCAVRPSRAYRGTARNVGQTPRPLASSSGSYHRSSCDAGVPPASFFVNGSQGPPCDPHTTPLVSPLPLPSSTRSVRRPAASFLSAMDSRSRERQRLTW